MFAQTLEVYAAASLREAFTTVARAFERTHSGVRVRLQFAGSQTLAAQIANGAPADVFASADARNLDRIAYDPKTRRVFATNRLVVVTKGRNLDLRNLRMARSVVLAARSVPAGGYARQALERAAKTYGADWLRDVNARIVSEEPDVRAALTKVELGEADAGIVYATDARASKRRLFATPVEKAFNPRIEYPAAVPKDAPEPRLAREFVEFLRSKTSQRALTARGFGPP